MIEILPEKRGDYVLPEIAGLYQKRTDLVTDMVQRHIRSAGIKLYLPGTGKGSKPKSDKEGDAVDVRPKRAVIEVGFHSLRHTFVSFCREKNAPLAVVESIVGHSNPAMTRHYTHVGELAAGRAVALLPSVIGNDEQESDGGDILTKIQTVAKSMTAANWKAKRGELLALISNESK